jgi:hypothetical protein
MKRQGKVCRGRKSGTPNAPTEGSISKDDRARWIGSMRDSIRIIGDIVSPATDESDWEVLGDEDPAWLKRTN